jgi:hypothetical protein
MPPDARPGGGRRIDRVLDAAFLDGLSRLPIDVLRRRRQDARHEEADLSYLRRLLQGRIDILSAEVHRRQAGDRSASVLAQLSTILAEERPSRVSSARHLSVAPRTVGEYRREFERLIADVDFPDVLVADDARLSATVATLAAYERQISAYRKRLQQVADRCGEELACRYRDGSARVEDLLPAERRPE